MTSEFADIDEGSAGHELLGDEGMAKVIDLGILDTGKHKEAVDAGSDIADEEGVASFGNKDVLGTTLGAFGQVVLESGFGGGI